MSLIRILQYVRDKQTLAGLSPSARHLLAWLAIHAGRGDTVEPSVHELAQLMGITDANVRRNRRELEQAGVIAVTYRTHRANVYRFPVTDPVEAVEDDDPTCPQPARYRAGAVPRDRALDRAPDRAVPRDQEQEQGEVLTVRDAFNAGITPSWYQAMIHRMAEQGLFGDGIEQARGG